MRSGLLRHSITVQQPVETQDSAGAVVASWVTYADLRAAYEPQSGREGLTEDHVQAFGTVRFRTRYIAGVTPKMRVLFDSRVFNIQSVIDVGGRGKQLHILTEEQQ